MTFKVGFDISQTGSMKAGCGFFADSILRSILKLQPDIEFDFYTSFGDFYFDPTVSVKSIRKDAIDVVPNFTSRAHLSNYWYQENLEAELNNPNIIHSNNYWCPNNLTRSRLVYTLYDLSFIHHSEWTTEVNRYGCFNGVLNASMHADWVVAISQYSANDFIRIFPHYPRSRIKVIYPCSRFDGAENACPSPKFVNRLSPNRFWLSVGTIEPRKNQLRILEAYKYYLLQGGEPIPMIFAGGQGWMMDDFSAKIKTLGLEDMVMLTGYVSDSELVWLYKNCFANIYVSLFEGFGLPILEGMKFGAPTICSNTSSMPEIIGDAGIMVNPLHIDSITNSMLRISENPGFRNSLSLLSRKQATRFNWDTSSNLLLDLYLQANQEPKLIDIL